KADAGAEGGRILAPCEAGVFEREQRAGDAELREAVEALEAVRRKEARGIPVANLAAAVGFEFGGVERADACDAAAPGTDALPKGVLADAATGDGAEAGDDHPPPRGRGR